MVNNNSNPMPPRSSCRGTQATLPGQGSCPDPGTVAQGQNLIVSDTNLCPKRLLALRDSSGNVLNAVIAVFGNGQTAVFMPTQQPKVPYPNLIAAQGQSFGQLVLASALDGTHNRLSPPVTPNLVMQTDGAGGLKLDVVPGGGGGGGGGGSVPDPLTIGTININTLLNLAAGSAATFAGPIALTGVVTATVAAGTVISFLGLNSTNQIVRQQYAPVLKAWFFESGSRTSGAYPNLTAQNTTIPVIGNALYSADGIAVASNTTSVVLTTSGTYEIEWSGAFGLPNASQQTPGLALMQNGNVINPGQRGLTTIPGNMSSATVSGKHIGAFTANDTLQLFVQNPSALGSPSTSGQSLNLRDVEMFVTKFH